MRPFIYQRPDDLAGALAAARGDGAGPPTMAATQFLAGGTTILDLMKLDVMQPETLVDIGGIDPMGMRVERRPEGLYLGAFVTMAQAGDHPEIRQHYPMVAQSLDLAASPQIRNMATLGGNVLQRTRCTYFRDASWDACNKREPGSGCSAFDGVNRKHAVLGTSDKCIATYPGDFAQALVALGAMVDIVGAAGGRVVPFEALHREPGDNPDIETTLKPGEVIRGFTLPAAAWTRRSLYLKIRDRQSYEFALASAAVALDLEDGIVNVARIALGGVATKPWRAHEAETVLAGQRLDEIVARRAAQAAFSGARTHGDNAYKRELGERTLARAVMQAAQISI